MSDRDFWNRQTLQYVPPAKGSPYGMIQPVSAPVQSGPNPVYRSLEGLKQSWNMK